MSSLLKSCNSGIAPTVDLKQGLVAHYLLNNNGDDSYGTYDATVEGTPNFAGDHFSNDQIDDNVRIDSALRINTTVKTVSLWVYFDSNDSDINRSIQYMNYDESGTFTSQQEFINCILDIDANKNPYVFAQLYDNGTYRNGATVTNTSITAEFDQWHHFILESDGRTYIKGYLNGVLVGTSTATASVITLSNDYINLGLYSIEAKTGETPNYTYKNRVSNVRVYDGVKDQTFIDALYAEGYYPKPLPLPTTDGLVAYYPLTGTAEDAWGAGGNESGTEYNGVTFVTDVDRGSVANFDGVDDYITTPSMNLGNTFTLSGWVKLDTNTNLYPIMIGGGSTDFVMSLGFNHSSGSLNFILGNGSSWELPLSYTIGTIPLNTYMHVAITIDSGSAILYYNGENVGNGNFTNSFNDIINLGYRRPSQPADYYLDGKLSDIRIYDRALTATEITALYNEVDEPTDGLIAHYPLTTESRASDMWVAYDGTENGGLTYVDDAEFGSVADITSTKNVSIKPSPTAFKTQLVSISAYVKVDSIGTIQYIVSNSARAAGSGFTDNSGCGIRVQPDGKVAGLYIMLNNESTTDSLGFTDTSYIAYAISNYTAVVGEWFHVAMYVNDNSLGLYINGVLNVTVSSVQSMRYSTTDDNYGIGHVAYDASIQLPLDGRTRDVRHYNRVLTAQEIADIYNYEKNFRPIDIDDGLVQYYPLDNNSLDNYYNQKDGTDSGSPVYNGEYATYPLYTDYTTISSPYLPASMNFTISGWANVGSGSYVDYMMSWGSNVEIAFGVRAIESVLRLQYVNTSSAWQYASADYTNYFNKWTHIAVVLTTASIKLFLDGELVETVASPTTLRTNYTTQYLATYMSGGSPIDSAQPNRKFAKIRTFNKAKSDEQIAAIYNSEKGDFGL